MPEAQPAQTDRTPSVHALSAVLMALLTVIALAAAIATPAGAAVTAVPGPTAKNASIWSEISFRGVKASRSGRITVRGSRSGRHGYVRKRHGDNRGFSLLLRRPLAVSESVTVKTGLRVYGARRGDWRFRTENLRLSRNKKVRQVARPSTGQDGFVTRPNLKPPVLDVKSESPKASDRPLFVASKVAGNTIYDGAGDPVWFRPGIAMDLRRQKWRGKPVLTWIEVPTKGSGLDRTTYMIANTNYRVIRKLTPGNGYSADTHEFRLTPRGTAYVTSYRTRIRDLRKVGQSRHGRVSDSIAQEIDLKTGRVIWEWHSLDHVPVGETYAEHPRRPGNPFDYFHINTVADTPDGNVLISGRSTNTVYKVNRRTGRVMWRLGGRRSTFRMGRGTRFSWQHDSQLRPGNLVTIYDNSDSPVTSSPWAKQSSGVILKLNYRKKTARLKRRLVNPAKPLASTQGNVQTLPGGNYLVGWGGVPLVSEYTAHGNLVFDARLQGISSFYRAYRAPWHGRPKGRPALVAKLTDNPGQTRFWVSHNGDTDTRTWRVWAGPSKNHLTHVADRARDGFETVTAAPTDATFFQVRGVDAKGRTTGVSKVIRTER